MERRLAAILIADVVGYSRHARESEEETRERFNLDMKDVVTPITAKHAGRVVKTMGDGILVEFMSIVDATRCAVEWQSLLSNRSSGGSDLVYRIGINLGDVILEASDIHGDGVNVAERLQSMAEPGGIALSGAAYERIKSKAIAPFFFFGDRPIKNGDEPIKVYRTGVAGQPLPRPHARQWLRRPHFLAIMAILVGATASGLALFGRTTSIPLDPSLIVFAFDDQGTPSAIAYLASGIADDLTTDLANLSGVRVLSRKAAIAYQGKAVSPQEIGEALRVRYVVQGSIRSEADVVRINAQLVDTSNGATIWARRFEGEWKRFFPLQDQLKAAIADYLSLNASAMQGAAKPGATLDTDAYEEYLKAAADWRDGSPAAVGRAIDRLKRATKTDPTYGRAWALMAYIYWNATGIPERMDVLGMDRMEIMQDCMEALEKAKQWPSPVYYQTQAEILSYQMKHEAAVEAGSKAVALDPSDAAAYEAMSTALIYAGRPREALALVEAANRVDPISSGWRRMLKAMAAFVDEQYGEALAHLQSVGSDEGEVWTNYFSQYLRVASFVYLGKVGEIKPGIERLNILAKEITGMQANILLAQGLFPFKREEDGARLFDALSKAGIPRLPYSFTEAHGESLKASEIQKLIFGHTLEGTNLRNGSVVERYTSETGVSSYIHKGKTVTGGITTIEHNTLCDWWLDGRTCSAILIDISKDKPAGQTYFWIDA